MHTLKVRSILDQISGYGSFLCCSHKPHLLFPQLDNIYHNETHLWSCVLTLTDNCQLSFIVPPSHIALLTYFNPILCLSLFKSSYLIQMQEKKIGY